MISIAMTTFNGEKYIVQQLESIRKQILPPDEVIIVDDMSTDNTIELIDNYILNNDLKESWHLHINSKRLGFVKNFQKAISLTTGDYVFLSDQDDIFLENKIKVMMSYFDFYPDCLLLNANYSYIDNNSATIDNYILHSCKRNKMEKLSFEKMLFNSNYPGFSMGFRSSIRKDFCEINLDNFYGHDIALNLLAIKRDGCYACNDILSLYRQHENNTSLLYSNKKNDLGNRIIQKSKELKEYYLLKKFLRDNKIDSNSDFLQERMNTLQKRIDALQKKKIISLVRILMTNNAYPLRTIIGDIIYLFK